MMVNIFEAKAKLSSILRRVALGESVILCRRNVPIAEIRPIRERKMVRRPIGLARRKYKGFTVPDSFFEPLPDDILDLFEGKLP